MFLLHKPSLNQSKDNRGNRWFLFEPRLMISCLFCFFSCMWVKTRICWTKTVSDKLNKKSTGEGKDPKFVPRSKFKNTGEAKGTRKSQGQWQTNRLAPSSQKFLKLTWISVGRNLQLQHESHVLTETMRGFVIQCQPWADVWLQLHRATQTAVATPRLCQLAEPKRKLPLDVSKPRQNDPKRCQATAHIELLASESAPLLDTDLALL